MWLLIILALFLLLTIPDMTSTPNPNNRVIQPNSKGNRRQVAQPRVEDPFGIANPDCINIPAGSDMIIKPKSQMIAKLDNMQRDPVTGMRLVNFTDCYTNKCSKLAKEACTMPLIDQDKCYNTQLFGYDQIYPHSHTMLTKENNYKQVTNNIMTDLPCDCRSPNFQVCSEKKKIHEKCYNTILSKCLSGATMS